MQKKLLIIIASLSLVLLSVLLGGNLILDKVADRVVQKLKRDYVPGPYDPGFDPDKVNPSIFSTTESN
jgi:hypothetical protein